jgi:hypothetical protein
MRGRVQEGGRGTWDNTCRIDWARRSLDPIRQREPEASSTQISTNKVTETRVDGPTPKVKECQMQATSSSSQLSGHSFSFILSPLVPGFNGRAASRARAPAPSG